MSILEPRVCIIIVTFNKKESLQQSIKAIQDNNYHNKQVIVVDNASTDGTIEMLSSEFPFVMIIRSAINTGYTGGNNIGIKYAIEVLRADYLLILNDDAISDKNLIKELVRNMEMDPEIVVASPKIYSFENPQTLCQNYGDYNYYLGLNSKPLTSIESPEEIALLRGTCFLISSRFIKIGGLFDTNYFMYFDEANLSFRIRKLGYKIVFVPSARIYHQLINSSSGKTNSLVLYYSTRNELLFARNNLNMILFVFLWIPRFFLRLIICWTNSRNIEMLNALFFGFYDFTKSIFGKSNRFALKS
jgi:GT2 family glycosyltransferase